MSAVGLSDKELSQALHQTMAQGRTLVRVVANKFVARIATASPTAPDQWQDVGHGDIEQQTLKALESAAKPGWLLWVTTTESDLDAANVAGAETVDKDFLKKWMQEREKVTIGRSTEVNTATRYEIASRAAWRCQFDGCGEDLRETLAPRARGNYGYYAHIVASSKDGPRGDEVNSPRLANDASNIMLLCDKHHRLIDRVDPSRYKIPVLRKMRDRNLTQVKRALDSLRYPEATMIVIGGNIEGQQLWVDKAVAAEAMLLRRLQPAEHVEWFGQLGSHIGASNSQAYWQSLFIALKDEIPTLRRLLAGSAAGGERPKSLAIFPKHGTSVLVLFGRLIGELGATHLFQPHRDQVSGNLGGEWATPDVPEPAADKFKLIAHREPQVGDSEVVLQINLTARIPGSELGPSFHDGVNWRIPVIELTVDDCSHRVMSHEKDAELFGICLDAALRRIQDEWRLQTVHLFVVAPTTACFRAGQKMQARHHADFQLYERVPGGREFAPTIKISPTEVSLLSTGTSVLIS